MDLVKLKAHDTLTSLCHSHGDNENNIHAGPMILKMRIGNKLRNHKFVFIQVQVPALELMLKYAIALGMELM